VPFRSRGGTASSNPSSSSGESGANLRREPARIRRRRHQPSRSSAARPFCRSIGVSHFSICLACPSTRRSIASVPDKARAMPLEVRSVENLLGTPVPYAFAKQPSVILCDFGPPSLVKNRNAAQPLAKWQLDRKAANPASTSCANNSRALLLMDWTSLSTLLGAIAVWGI
jgi:hypothetical protein